MVTKNYGRFISGVNSQDEDYFNYNICVKDVSGELKKIAAQREYAANPIQYVYTQLLFNKISLRAFPISTDSMSDSATGMFFGSGTTPPTSDDYSIENLIEFSENGLCVIASNLVKMTTDDTLYTYTFTVQNKGATPIVISESALISSAFYYPKQTTLTFLWARDTFEPVTLQPGETRPFTMTIGLE